MRKEVTALLQELERRDAAERDRGLPSAERARNIRPEVGQFLNLLIKVTRPRTIVEVGTSNGYSTLWLAEAGRQVGSRVVTMEVRPDRHAEATAHLSSVGLKDGVDLQLGDAHQLIPQLKGPFDLVFLDAEKDDYVPLAQKLLPKLRSGSLLVADNITSHPETKEYVDYLEAQPGLLTTLVPLGRGEAVTLRLSQPLPDALLKTLAAQEERNRVQSGMFQVPREEGALLHSLALATGARRILEVGMSGGYSTLWLAQAALANKGKVISVERDTAKVNLARRNFVAANLTNTIEVQIGDAERVLSTLDGPFDFIFLDADKENQIDYLETVLPLVTPGGLILSDNHLTHPNDMAAYTAYVRSYPGLESLLLPVGNGLEMTWKVKTKG